MPTGAGGRGSKKGPNLQVLETKSRNAKDGIGLKASTSSQGL